MTRTRRQPIQWLTPEQVKAAAKRGRKAAIECSREHWRQLSEATPAVLRKHHIAWWDECGLCQRYNQSDCRTTRTCPLYAVKRHSEGWQTCVDDWYAAVKALNDWKHATRKDRAVTLRRWKRAAKRMYRLLLECK